jgi:hypothetical protein
MIANSVYSASFVKALLYATKSELLVNQPKSQKKTSLPETTKAVFAQESDTLLKDLKGLEAALGKEALTLTVFRGYVRRLVKNPRFQRYLERKHKEILGVFAAGMEEARTL